MRSPPNEGAPPLIHSHTREVRLGRLHLTPTALARLHRTAQARMEDEPRRGAVKIRLHLTYDRRGASTTLLYTSVAELVEDAREANEALARGAHWSLFVDARDASVSLRSRVDGVFDQRTVVRVQGPDAEWTRATADAVRDALAPYASGPLRTLARTRGAMIACCALPFVTIAGLGATTTGVSWLDALPWLALTPFVYRIVLGTRAQSGARLQLGALTTNVTPGRDTRSITYLHPGIEADHDPARQQ